MEENKMFKAYIGFNTDYFKVGQLIKVEIRNLMGMLIKRECGFVSISERDYLVFNYINRDGIHEERTIVPDELRQKDVDVKIEILEDK